MSQICVREMGETGTKVRLVALMRLNWMAFPGLVERHLDLREM
jgi:hypothetical protein